VIVDAPPVRTIPAGEFKARCLKLMDEVNETGVSIVITKRGRPVSRLMPVEQDRRAISGLLPELRGFWDDPAESVIEPEDVRSLEAVWDTALSRSLRRDA
jgi:prevent-host-death family protein